MKEKLKDASPIITLIIGVVGVVVSFLFFTVIALCVFIGVFITSAVLMWKIWFRKEVEK